MVTDEVYEHLVYDGAHVPIATLPGMRERTVTISSGGKTFSFTGWKVGWICAAPALTDAVRTVKQFLTYVNADRSSTPSRSASNLYDDYFTGPSPRCATSATASVPGSSELASTCSCRRARTS